MKQRSILFYCPLSIIMLCNSGCGNMSDKYSKEKEYQVLYAEGFRVIKEDSYTQVKILDPWDKSRILQTLILVDREHELTDDLPEGIVIKTPVTSNIICNDLHYTILEELGVVSTMKGYIGLSNLTNNNANKIKSRTDASDLGTTTYPNLKKISEVNAEIVFNTPLNNNNNSKIENLKIPVIQCVDYKELTPLGRAEWIRLYGMLFDKENEADSIFEATVNHYNEMKEVTTGLAYRPTVITGLKSGKLWYVHGGASYYANLYRDAGATYLWNDSSTGALTLTFDSVYSRAANADYWIIRNHTGKKLTYSTLETDSRLNAGFEAWKERNIFVCDMHESDLHARMVFHPDSVLQNLINILYPDLLENDEMRFFREMEE